MILVTVGTQFGFDRLIQWMDLWAVAHPDVDVFAQIGDGDFQPAHMRWTREISPMEFPSVISTASVIVSHAGMGTIISANLSSKTIIIVPRRADLGEHRNEHQLATARRFSDLPGCRVAETQEQLDAHLANLDSSVSASMGAAAGDLSQRIFEFLEREPSA
ncbi:glycosyltransferase [Stenotrophomonas geniculata]|uniref:glycosyltransferase n=1 Tax=Stenotrophomonas geniculata TaxID=86188 RepID=UPI0003687142|nr:glycosyltransferase [Stenotrophomonas geniculata]MDC7799932.1 glycosyltransferase [Stenotrophomonas geniculata]MDV6187998.1 glycosyltransferase [Stenotrophomonas geniculata]QHE22863.1 hypothetical protein GS396_18885 [Stenotrophomonas maltophilia]